MFLLSLVLLDIAYRLRMSQSEGKGAGAPLPQVPAAAASVKPSTTAPSPAIVAATSTATQPIEASTMDTPPTTSTGITPETAPVPPDADTGHSEAPSPPAASALRQPKHKAHPPPRIELNVGTPALDHSPVVTPSPGKARKSPQEEVSPISTSVSKSSTPRRGEGHPIQEITLGELKLDSNSSGDSAFSFGEKWKDPESVKLFVGQVGASFGVPLTQAVASHSFPSPLFTVLGVGPAALAPAVVAAAALFCFQIPKTLNEELLRPFFEQAGPIYDFVLIRDHHSSTHQGKYPCAIVLPQCTWHDHTNAAVLPLPLAQVVPSSRTSRRKEWRPPLDSFITKWPWHR